LLASALVLGANRAITPQMSLPRRALLDEAAHVATTALALDATSATQRPFRLAALVSTVLIDVDHVPDKVFGVTLLTRHAPRPFTHSLSTIAVILLISRMSATAQRPLFNGVAF